MSHSAFDHQAFAEAREWRRQRARIAACVRHGNAREAERIREFLPAIKDLGRMRAIVNLCPGIFEMGTELATDGWYSTVDMWIQIRPAGVKA